MAHVAETSWSFIDVDWYCFHRQVRATTSTRYRGSNGFGSRSSSAAEEMGRREPRLRVLLLPCSLLLVPLSVFVVAPHTPTIAHAGAAEIAIGTTTTTKYSILLVLGIVPVAVLVVAGVMQGGGGALLRLLRQLLPILLGLLRV